MVLLKTRESADQATTPKMLDKMPVPIATGPGTIKRIDSTHSLLDSVCSLMEDKVRFDPTPATVIAYVEPPSELEVIELFWYTNKQTDVLRAEAEQYANELQDEQPGLTKGLDNIYNWAEAQEATDIFFIGLPNHPTPSFLFNKWASLGSNTRGLEKQVLSRDRRRDHESNVAASRKVVLRIQQILRKSPSHSGTAKEDMISQKYRNSAHPCVFLAAVMGRTDAEILNAANDGSRPGLTRRVRSFTNRRSRSPTPSTRRQQGGGSPSPSRSSPSRSSTTRNRSGREGLELQQARTTRDGLLERARSTREVLRLERNHSDKSLRQRSLSPR